MNRIFVGNLNFRATEEELWDFFKTAGHPPSEVRILTDRDTGRSRGFGFVTLAEGGDMERAIGDLNGSEFQSRALTVNEAKPMPEPGSRPSNGGARRHDRQPARGRREARW
jgi:cold-inducible RNA-binding protein